MRTEEIFDRLLEAYSVYYNVEKENAELPFDAEAVFKARHEQYFLMKSAKLAEIDANEYVYFIKKERAVFEEIKELSGKAWERGLLKVTPDINHKSSDVILIVVADKTDEELKRSIKSIKFSKSYKLGLNGFSSFKLAVIEASTGLSFYNGQGKALKSTVQRLCAG